MTRFQLTATDNQWVEFPTCPYCGQDAAIVTSDYGYDEYDGFSGYEVDCGACGKPLGHFTYAEEAQHLIERIWPTLKGDDDVSP